MVRNMKRVVRLLIGSLGVTGKKQKNKPPSGDPFSSPTLSSINAAGPLIFGISSWACVSLLFLPSMRKLQNLSGLIPK